MSRLVGLFDRFAAWLNRPPHPRFCLLVAVGNALAGLLGTVDQGVQEWALFGHGLATGALGVAWVSGLAREKYEGSRGDEQSWEGSE